MRRWSFVVSPVAIAVLLLLATWPRDRGTILSGANVALGAAVPAAAAAAPGAPARKEPVAPPASGAKGAGAGWDNFDVRRAPSVDAATIARVLAGYDSPAVGAAETMYALGVRYGIDPAFCLAFFIHESSAGTAGVARVTKSVGNIRTTPGYRDYQGYRHYDSWEQGIEDWYRLIKELYIEDWGLTTVDAIIPVYAPSSDGNNPAGYTATVKRLVDGWRQ
jgi:hypothetical protein